MNKTFKKLTILFLALTLAVLPAASVQASTKSDAQKVLEYYKKGKISKAKKYNNKLAKKASKTSIKNLSKKAKAAYRKKVQSYLPYQVISASEVYMWGYYLADLDGDKKAELLLQLGSNEANVKVYVFTYKNGKLKKIGEEYCSYASFYAYPGHSGVIYASCRQGVEDVSTLYVKNGKLKMKSYGGRTLEKNESYFPFRQLLPYHIKHKNGVTSIDVKDLK